MKLYRVLPFEWHERDGQIHIARGGYTARFTDPAIADMLVALLSTDSEPVDIGAVRATFAAPERPVFDQLVRFLGERRILVALSDDAAESAPPEGPRDVMFWAFSQSTASVRSQLDAIGICVVGVNRTSAELCRSLIAAGAPPALVIDDPLMRNRDLFDDAQPDAPRWDIDLPVEPVTDWHASMERHGAGCIVATTDHGATHHLKRWNARCLAHGLHFYPVALEQYVGRMGPLLIPGETACYGCLVTRENAARPTASRIPYEASPRHAYDAAAGFLPAMTTALGAMASIELLKFYAHLLPTPADRLVEHNFIGGKSTSRPVLKVPRCPVCSDLLAVPETQILKEPPLVAEISDFHRTHG